MASRPAKHHVFNAHCANCARETAFVAYKAERSVVAKDATPEEHVARMGFRCNVCRRIESAITDTQGLVHRWENLQHVIDGG